MSDDELRPSPRPDDLGPLAEVGPLGPLPQLSRRQVDVERHLGPDGPAEVARLVEDWNSLLGNGLVADRFAVQWRAAGLRRPGVVAHLLWPRFRTRVGFGIDPPLAHAVVDRLLGHERTPAEARLQVSPVEWGVLTFVIASGLERLEDRVGPIGPWDLAIDRVGPDPFDPADLGPIVTWRWRVRVGAITGSARLWIPDSLLAVWLGALDPGSRVAPLPMAIGAGDWRVEAGQITGVPAQDRAYLIPGRLCLIDNAPLTGTTTLPVGDVRLTQTDHATQTWFSARLDSVGAGIRLVVTSEPTQTSTSRMATMTDSRESRGPDPAGSGSSAALAVGLTVELGRVQIPLRRLVDLAPGDVIEFDRGVGELVDLTADGRLVARGELVQVDTELGVRITQTYV